MQDQRIAPPTRRRAGAPGRPKPACSPACTSEAIGGSREATYHSSMTTSPAAAISYLTRREGRVAYDIDSAGRLVVLVPARGTGDVTAPGLVIMGEADADFAGALNGQVLMVPGAGHYPQSQRPGITTPAVVRFADTVNDRA
jgi:pimeloyl-ACP methyl ester carboxylesterase